jgi:hypothetical protein
MVPGQTRRMSEQVARDIAMLCRNDGFRCSVTDIRIAEDTGEHPNEALASRILNYIEQFIEQGEIK